MNKKSILLTLLMLALACFSLQAQDDRESRNYVAHGRAYHSDDTNVVKGEHGVGWIRAHFLDDWFMQLQGGGLLYYGTDDRLGPFGDRLTALGEFRIGRRIFPMLGFRAGIGYGYAHGFLSKDLYYQDRLSIIGHGASGQCGTDASGLELGGYYWDYNDELLIQKWKFFYTGIDFFLDLGFFNGASRYDPTKKWNNFVYAGINVNFARSETDTNNHRSQAHIGYIGKYNITPHLSAYVDARVGAIERLFDREWVPSVESASFGVDWNTSVQVGIQYKFHIRTTEQRDLFTRQDKSEHSTGRAITHVSYVKMEKTFEMRVIDTLLKYSQVNIPTPETRHVIDSLRSDIDSTLNANKEKVWNQPLDSIFINQLLPYEMVFFEKDKWEILPSEEMKIDKMARIMKAYPNEKFLLTGSADSKTGTPYRNDFLSHQRADVVYEILVNQYGIEPERLERQYLGGILDYQPFQLNRCTVIIMDHPTVKAAFEEIRKAGQAGSGEVQFNH